MKPRRQSSRPSLHWAAWVTMMRGVHPRAEMVVVHRGDATLTNFRIMSKRFQYTGARCAASDPAAGLGSHRWTEPLIFILITLNAIVLTLQAFPSLTLPKSNPPAPPPTIKGYFHTWEDWVLFVLFSIFTLEAFARICVLGFLFDPKTRITPIFSPLSSLFTPTHGPSRQPPPPQGHNISQQFRRVRDTLFRRFAPSTREYIQLRSLSPTQQHQIPTGVQSEDDISESASHAIQDVRGVVRGLPEEVLHYRVMRSGSGNPISLPFRLNIILEKSESGLPYLRHSWTQIDFVAIVGFWIMFALAMSGIERGRYHIGLFRAMSAIRTGRLLMVTLGTTTTLNSLKGARPLLTSVACFVGFVMVLFSIIGVQLFRGSLRRSCVLSATRGEADIPLDSQFCGGYIDPTTFQQIGYQMLRGGNAPINKGYICPLGQVCKENENPKDNLESFDAIWYAALQVVITTTNGWAPLMYAMVDSEYFISSIFFIVCVVVLNFWLINLFVAVITNTFAATRSRMKRSAFGVVPVVLADQDAQDDGWDIIDGPHTRRVHQNWAKIIYQPTRWGWILLSFASLALQVSHQTDTSQTQRDRMSHGELGITIAFDIEIILRILAVLPDWRSFWLSRCNVLDLVLAIACTVIQIPRIRENEVYGWLSIFQLARFYRVILEVPRMRPLLLAAFGPLYNLVNMFLFLILINYVSALVAVQFLRGDFAEDTTHNFGELFNAFITAWQLFSTDNWTEVLYGATHAEIKLGQALVVVICMVSWVLFSNFVVLQMFIAVIHENFDATEEVERTKQVNEFWEMQKTEEDKPRWMKLLNPYRWRKATPVRLAVNRPPSERSRAMELFDSRKPRNISSKALFALEILFTRRAGQPQFEVGAQLNPRQNVVDDLEGELYERRALKADFIRDHPSYDRVFWIISQKNWVRRLCQKVVQPARDERIFGTPHSPIGLPIFQFVILLAVIGSIVVEGIATPIYRLSYYNQHGLVRGAWFNITEIAFVLILFTEFMIKVIADGFIWTPNAYLLSFWNILDFAIMVGIAANIMTSLILVGGLSRFTRSLKALRALRLITLIESMRNTFQLLIISGAVRILEAAVLAILCIIPYAVWGFNIFAGKMRSCNDKGATSMAECIGEYENSVVGESFGYMIPRVWDDPSPSISFSFDSFGASLLTLFEIVSLEGWTDVMFTATSITGRDRQPQTNASQSYAIFFLIFNFLGSGIILSLFASIIIRNFRYKTGCGFLTQPQREWIDLQRLLKLQKPSKRPLYRPTWRPRSWCYDRAVHNHGWWSRLMTVLFLLHVFALIVQTFSTNYATETLCNNFFLALLSIYILDIVIRLYGLGWRYFGADGWNFFDLIVAFGGSLVTLIVYFGSTGVAIQQLQKLFLVSIAFKLIQRMNTLNMWFKTIVSSLPAILSLLGFWSTLLVCFGILFVEVFGTTKWGDHENRNQNYSSFGSALVMLTFMSAGEGWNRYMHDFDLTYPRCTSPSSERTESDCGSTAWAFTLFIAWNILSMYIFVNMFTGVVVDNFSFAFRASGISDNLALHEQMRVFKKLWAEYASPLGYLERRAIGPFFSRLSGVFEVKTYPTEFSISNIISACSDNRQTSSGLYDLQGLDLQKMAKILEKMDLVTIKRRKAAFSRLYHEVMMSNQLALGISLPDMLVLLAHHKLIVDREALMPNDLIVRAEVNRMVTDLVYVDRIRSLLATIAHRRRFLTMLEKRRLARIDHEIPSITVGILPESDVVDATYSASPSSVPTSPNVRFT
ncbi:hypothetical protein P691DRAFT_761036 [Macrolepiota fuliginosa MF-IS2]|uniref:Calcium-channel protein CCH1 n=1 Tax=Macrolepiota fuliginosa MF-IS2 TaxID=1400762 RepID=A0A9P5X9U9_9AGAR|nr:hypothetical protein P691DRAFT_761036 [Macrolepiota fuliginosa MF-IS2]